MGEEKESLVSTNNRLQIKLDETEHDLEMAKRNLNQVTEMLEEKSQNSESVQQERLQHIAGETSQSGWGHDFDSNACFSNPRTSIDGGFIEKRAGRGQGAAGVERKRIVGDAKRGEQRH